MRLQRAYPDWLPEEAKLMALKNISAYAFMADHMINREVLVIPDPKECLSDPTKYGPALSALALYLRPEGPKLRDLVS